MTLSKIQIGEMAKSQFDSIQRIQNKEYAES